MTPCSVEVGLGSGRRFIICFGFRFSVPFWTCSRYHVSFSNFLLNKSTVFCRLTPFMYCASDSAHPRTLLYYGIRSLLWVIGIVEQCPPFWN